MSGILTPGKAMGRAIASEPGRCLLAWIWREKEWSWSDRRHNRDSPGERGIRTGALAGVCSLLGGIFSWESEGGRIPSTPLRPWDNSLPLSFSGRTGPTARGKAHGGTKKEGGVHRVLGSSLHYIKADEATDAYNSHMGVSRQEYWKLEVIFSYTAS